MNLRPCPRVSANSFPEQPYDGKSEGSSPGGLIGSGVVSKAYRNSLSQMSCPLSIKPSRSPIEYETSRTVSRRPDLDGDEALMMRTGISSDDWRIARGAPARSSE